MVENPYASPESVAMESDGSAAARTAALRRVRFALLILLAPAIYNFICYSRLADPMLADLHQWTIYWVMNGMAFFVTAAAIWFLGLGLLELLTVFIHRLFGRKAGLAEWKTALYQVLERLPSTAVLGAFLWVVWVIAFYHLGVGFYLISVPVGIAAHLLAASLYLSLFYRWYTLERREIKPEEG